MAVEKINLTFTKEDMGILMETYAIEILGLEKELFPEYFTNDIKTAIQDDLTLARKIFTKSFG